MRKETYLVKFHHPDRGDYNTRVACDSISEAQEFGHETAEEREGVTFLGVDRVPCTNDKDNEKPKSASVGETYPNYQIWGHLREYATNRKKDCEAGLRRLQIAREVQESEMALLDSFVKEIDQVIQNYEDSLKKEGK